MAGENNALLLVAGVTLVIGALIAYSTTMVVIEENTFKDKKILERGMDLPVIWLYMDTSDLNSRSWADFMGRSSYAINLPFLNLCYQTIVAKNKKGYRVEVIGGLADLARRLGGWEALPVPLRNNLAPVGEAELTWIRAAVLAKWGGLWLHPATVCLKPFPAYPSDKIVFFGTDSAETYAGPNGTEAPGLRCLWSPKPEHPFFTKWEAICRERLDARGGGKQFRGDEKWEVRQLGGEFVNEVTYTPHAELTRKKGGRRIQLEDLLAAGQQGVLPFDIIEKSLYVPIPWPELRESRQFGWFMRMSEQQILESDLVISHLIRLALL